MYECSRCGYTTTFITNIRKHLKAKTTCPAIIEDISIETLRSKYNVVIKPHAPTHNNSTDSPEISTKIECGICHKKYANSYTLSRHQKKCINNFSQMKQEIEGLKNQIANLMNKPPPIPSSMSTSTSTTSVVSAPTNIVINQNFNTGHSNHSPSPNPFLSEDMYYLSDEYILKCAKKLNNGLIDFIKNVRFNPEHPENMNVKMHRMKNKTLFVYNANRWQVCDAKWTLEEMIVHGAKIFHQKILTHFDQEKLLEQDSSESKIQSWLLSLLPRNNEKIMGILSKRIYAMILDNHLLLMEQDQEHDVGSEATVIEQTG